MSINLDLILRQNVQADIINAQYDSYSKDFKAWIASGAYYLNSVNTQNQFTISISNRYAYFQMLAFEACKMSCMAFETANSIQKISSNPKSLAWNSIKAYYAAYFSAHAIMRCFGRNASFLEDGHVDLLNRQARAAGLNSIQAGSSLIVAEYNQTSGILTAIRQSKTHEDTWKAFSHLLQYLSKEVLLTNGVTADKQALSTYFYDLRNELQHHSFSNGNWLSYMRNSINYRQEYGLWYPYSSNRYTYNDFSRIFDLWKNKTYLTNTSALTSDDLKDFFLLSAKVVNLCYQLINSIIDVTPNAKSPFTVLPKRLLKATMPM